MIKSKSFVAAIDEVDVTSVLVVPEYARTFVTVTVFPLKFPGIMAKQRFCHLTLLKQPIKLMPVPAFGWVTIRSVNVAIWS